MTINDKRNVFSWCIRIITTRTHVSTSSFSNHHCNDKTFWFQPYLQASLFMIIFKKGWTTLCTVCTIVWKIRKLRIAHQLLPYNTSWNILLNMFCGHLSCFMWTLLEILTFVNKKRYINMFIIVNLSIKVIKYYISTLISVQWSRNINEPYSLTIYWINEYYWTSGKCREYAFLC